MLSVKSKESFRLLLGFLRLALDYGQDFVLAHDEVFLAVELDFLPGILSEQDEVAGFDIEGDALPVVLGFPVAGGDDLALLGFFLGGIRDDDAADLLLAFFDALNNDPVVQRSDVHALYSVWREVGNTVDSF